MEGCMLQIFQILVFFLGIYSLTLSVKYLVFFVRVERRVARSMVYLMTEQVVSASCTMAFSVNSLMGTLVGESQTSWNNIDPLTAIVLRAAMFGAMIHSNVHLSRSIKKVIEGSQVIHQSVICERCKSEI